MRLARRIVHANWPSVEAVAAALDEKGSLTGDEVVALMSGR